MRTIHWKSHANNLNANKWTCQLWSDPDDGNNILQGLLKPVKIIGGVEATRFETVDLPTSYCTGVHSGPIQ